MNESETRAELIDPKLKASGWGEVDGSKVLREYQISPGKILSGGERSKKEIADYILVYKNQKLAVIEAKSDEHQPTEGVTQAKVYAAKLNLTYTYATNGKDIYEINLNTGKEWSPERFPTPNELWTAVFGNEVNQNQVWHDKFDSIPFENVFADGIRYYQEIAVNKTLRAIAEDKKRMLLTLATGTGKTTIAFQIAWKLFQTRWNLNRDGGRRPRILFLADRNILADQAFNNFSKFPEDALVRINPHEVKKIGNVPTNGSIFFTIFQTFMSGPNDSPYFGDYPPDFFDFIIIDECHRGGAGDESSWRRILEYFAPAVQLGLTATPKRKDNVDTYAYFGDPLYTYSLKQGVNDGFLTPFKVKRIQTTLDDYVYTSDDEVLEGDVEQGKIYTEEDFNRIIEIKEREKKRVEILMHEIDQDEKTIVFCATQDHALAVRDLINQTKTSTDPNYCVRVTANEGARGDQFLRDFQDNEKIIPTILTTSRKLSTGVDARNVRNIVLMRPVNDMIEFKQIIGRGTRLFDGKEFFTILDFVNAYKMFSDPEWDGEPISELSPAHYEETKPWDKGVADKPDEIIDNVDYKPMTRIKLRDGKEREIQHMIATSFWSADGKPMSTEEFMQSLFGALPNIVKDEQDLHEIWSNPVTRKSFLNKISEQGFGITELRSMQSLIKAEDSDLLDTLAYVAYATPPVTRQQRKDKVALIDLSDSQKEFAEFVLDKYVESGSSELSESKLPDLINLKYQSIVDAEQMLGGTDKIRSIFFDIQRQLFIYSTSGVAARQTPQK